MIVLIISPTPFKAAGQSQAHRFRAKEAWASFQEGSGKQSGLAGGGAWQFRVVYTQAVIHCRPRKSTLVQFCQSRIRAEVYITE
jgi:hypothetical protein